MKCRKCGCEIPDVAAFCPDCGVEVKMKHKNMTIALLISFFISGLGISYAGNIKNGILVFLVSLIFFTLGSLYPTFRIIGLVIWIAGLYITYRYVRKANGEKSHLICDIRGLSKPKKTLFGIFVLFMIFVIVVNITVPFIQFPSYESHYYNDYSTGDYSSSGGSHYHTVVPDRNTLAHTDPGAYYDHYEYGDDYAIDDYLESQGYD